MKVYLSTLGCKLNESELEAWARKFGDDGYQIVDDPQNADLVVLNTCTVTHVAARKSRQMARQLARTNPNAQLVLTGCYVSVSPDEAKNLPNVTLVVPNADKDRLVQIANSRWQMANSVEHMLEDKSMEPEAMSDTPSAILDADVETQVAGNAPTSNVQTPISSLRTRAFVKIQDGCNMSCTYCIIPMARGKEHSRPIAEVVDEVKKLVSIGYKEIILTGVQISSYHPVVARSEATKQSPSTVEIATSQSFDSATLRSGSLLAMTYGLGDLVAAILSDTAVPRLRLTSIAPWDVDEALLELFTDPRLCRHLHFSLQSGSDTALRRMRRPYTTSQFAQAVALAREKIPDVGITTDVIVGFPGESATEFEQSLEFVERMQFSRVHVFPYSPRAGTIAATLPLQVDDRTKDARMKQMQSIANASRRAFEARFIGREMKVLWETCQKAKDEGRKTKMSESFVIRHAPSVYSGYTDNYIRVLAPSDEPLTNQINLARLVQVGDDGLLGEVLKS